MLLVAVVVVSAAAAFDEEEQVHPAERDGSRSGPEDGYEKMCQRFHDDAQCRKEAKKPPKERLPPTVQRLAVAYGREFVKRIEAIGLGFSVEEYLRSFRERVQQDATSGISLCPDAKIKEQDTRAFDKPFVPKFKELYALMEGEGLIPDDTAVSKVGSSEADEKAMVRSAVERRAVGLFRQYRVAWARKDEALAACVRAQQEKRVPGMPDYDRWSTESG